MKPQLATTPAKHNQAASDTDARLTQLLRNLVEKPGIHHANVAVTSGNGERHWSEACRPAEQPGRASRPDTPFFVASITKRFIITLVLQAYERDELDLDAPMRRYLTDSALDRLHVLGGTDHTPAITVRHLASHTSGLPDYFEKRRGATSLHQHLATGEDVAWTFEDMLRMVRDQQRPHFEPQDLGAARQKARYSDTGFQLLIRILEAVTDRSFADLLAERILSPLGLRQTWLPASGPPVAAVLDASDRSEGSDEPDRADQEDGDRESVEISPLHARQRRVRLRSMMESSNDLISTTGDLLRFQRALLAGELFRDADTVRLLTERRNRLRNVPILGYGLGTMFFTVNRLVSPERRPVTLVGHSGATGTWLFHCPELDLHLAGTVDQTKGQAIPFRFMAQCLGAWRG